MSPIGDNGQVDLIVPAPCVSFSGNHKKPMRPALPEDYRTEPTFLTGLTPGTRIRVPHLEIEGTIIKALHKDLVRLPIKYIVRLTGGQEIELSSAQIEEV